MAIISSATVVVAIGALTAKSLLTHPPKADYLYIANDCGNNVTVFNVNAGQTVTSVPVGANAADIIDDSHNHSAYVANYGSASVSVIDTRTNKMVKAIPVAKQPNFLALDNNGGLIYVTSNASVSVINTNTNKVVTSIPLPPRVLGVAVDTQNGRIYVADSGSNSVDVIDSSTDTIVKQISFPANETPFAITYAPGYNAIFAGYGKSIAVISGYTDLVTKTIPLDAYYDFGYFDTGNGMLYTGNVRNGTVSVIDPNSNLIVATIKVGGSPKKITADPISGLIEVGNGVTITGCGGKLGLINPKDNQVVRSYNVGSGIYGIAAVGAALPMSHPSAPSTSTLADLQKLPTYPWGFNYPAIVSANASSLWVENLGLESPGHPDNWPNELQKIQVPSGKLVEDFLSSSCGISISLRGSQLTNTCEAVPSNSNPMGPNVELNQSTCSDLNRNYSTVAVTPRYIWIVSSEKASIFRIDSVTGQCDAIPGSSAWNVHQPPSYNMSTPSQGGTLFLIGQQLRQVDGATLSKLMVYAVDEQTNRLLWSKFAQPPAGSKGAFLNNSVVGNISLTDSELVIPIHEYGSRQCPGGPGYQVPCQDDFAILEMNISGNKPAMLLDSSSYGFGKFPRIDGFGTMVTAAESGDAWIGATDAGNVTEINVATGRPLRVINVNKITTWLNLPGYSGDSPAWERQPIDLAVANPYLWVVNGGQQGTSPETISEFSSGTGKPIRTIVGTPAT